MSSEKLALKSVSKSNFDFELIYNVFKKSLKILVRTDKKIRMLYSNCTNQHSFGNDFLVLNYRFRNALWYQINNLNTDRRQYVFSKSDSPKFIEIKVYGFFHSKVFKVNIQDILLLETYSDNLQEQFS